MDHNPYAPPKSNVELTSGSQSSLRASRLYSQKQIAVATFLGSPLAGGMHALAESKLGGVIKEHRAADGPLFSWWRVVGISLLCALILVVVVFAALFALATLAGIEF